MCAVRALRLSWIFVLMMLGNAAAQDARPNIVLVIGDDHGWPHSGFMGHPIVETPHLDALAAGGTVFRQAHTTSSLCQASLRALLGGVHWVEWNETRSFLDSLVGPIPRREEVPYFRTLPRELRRYGYLSWEGGSMWEGTYAQAGFTHGMATAVGSLLRSVGDLFGREGWDPGLCGDEAPAGSVCPALAPLRSFLDEVGSSPFFLWFAPKIPHTPFDAPASYQQRYQGLGLPALERAYYANVTWFDAVVGELLAELEARGLRENTLIVYLADNGWEAGQQLAGSGHGKGTMYELGFRTPLVFHWPGHVPAGVVRDDVVSSLDVFPTVLDYAGAAQVEDRSGRSLIGAVQSGAPLEPRTIVNYHPSPADPDGYGTFVRTDQWRYIVFGDGREELYEIAVDPFEENDVAADHPAELATFRAAADSWWTETFTPPPLLEIGGVLSDITGAPIRGASLRVRGRTDDGSRIDLVSLSAADGSFRFDHLPAGWYTMDPDRRVSDLRFGPFSDRIPVPIPLVAIGHHVPLIAIPKASLPVANDASVAGVLRTETGLPLAEATVSLRARVAGKAIRVVLRTGVSGEYRAESLPAGRYRIVAKVPSDWRHAPVAVELSPGERRLQDLIAVARRGA
jgi:arylsulfatase A